MGKLLTAVLTWAMSNFATRFLTSIGFAILGTITFQQFIDYFLSKMIAQFSNIPMLGLLGIAGIDKAVSIMITAVMIKAYLATAIQSLKLVKK